MHDSTPPSVIVLLSCAALSVTCTLLTLYIIKAINRWNGYIQLIFNLAVAQLIYDSSMGLIPLRRYSTVIEAIYITVRCFSGLASTCFTNVLASVVVYAVWKRSTFDIKKSLRIVKPFIIIPSIVVGSMVAISLMLDSGSTAWSYTYGFLRVLSILINIGLYVVLTCTLYRRNRNAPTKNDPLEVLVNRFKYYPVVQVLSRVAVVIHEVKYGFEYSYEQDGSVSLQKQISLYCYVITLPSLGILYFIVFLSVSPGAYSTLKLSAQRIVTDVCVCFGGGSDQSLSCERQEDEKKQGAESSKVRSRERGRDTYDDEAERERGSSVSSEHSSRSSASGFNDVLLLSDGGVRTGQSYSQNYSQSYSHSSHSRSQSDRQHRSERLSEYYDYDEEDLVKEIEKLYNDSLATTT